MPAVRFGDLVYTAGQLPMVDGTLHAVGKVGAEVSIEDAVDCARIAALNGLAAVVDLTGDLDVITRIVKATIYVASAPDFTDQSLVGNGASELLGDIFGDAGRHARSAVGRGGAAAQCAGRGRARRRRRLDADDSSTLIETLDAVALLRRPRPPLSEGAAGAWWSWPLAPAADRRAEPGRSGRQRVLLRDGEIGLETYLLHRHARMPFAAPWWSFRAGGSIRSITMVLIRSALDPIRALCDPRDSRGDRRRTG